MSEFDELPYTDFAADPEATENIGRRLGGVRSAALRKAEGVRIGGWVKRPGKIAAANARLDPRRADRGLRDFSGGGE